MTQYSENYHRAVFLLGIFNSQLNHISAARNGYSFIHNLYKSNKNKLRALSSFVKGKGATLKEIENILPIIEDEGVAALAVDRIFEIDFNEWVDIRANYIEALQKIERYFDTQNNNQMSERSEDNAQLVRKIEQLNRHEFIQAVREILSKANQRVGTYAHSSIDHGLTEAVFDEICMLVQLLSKHDRFGSVLYFWHIYQFVRFYEKPIPNWVLDYFDSSAATLHRMTDGEGRHRNDFEEALGLHDRRDFSRIYNFQRQFTAFHTLYEHREKYGKANEEFKASLADHFCISLDTLKKWESQIRSAIQDISIKMYGENDI